MSRLTHGAPVRINRPGKRQHGWHGRYLQESTAAAGHVEVAFDKQDKQTLPPLSKLHNQQACPRLTLPQAQVEVL